MAVVRRFWRLIPSFRLSQIKQTVCVIPIGVKQERYYGLKPRQAKEAEKKKQLKKNRAAAAVEASKQHEKHTSGEGWTPKLTREEIEKTYRPPPSDNVWIISEHKPQLFTVEEAVKLHRETHHPFMFNAPNALLYATMDVDMSLGERKTKPLDQFRGVVRYPNFYDSGKERRVLALCKDSNLHKEAIQAGAVDAGGLEVLERFKKGDLTFNDFEHIVVHPDMVTELYTVRGLIKHHFPTKQRGNLGIDIPNLVVKFVKGVDYKSDRDSLEPRYSTVDAHVGMLPMDVSAIEENLAELIREISEHRPKNVGSPFIISLKLWSPPSPEFFHIPFWQYKQDLYNSVDFIEKYTTVRYKEQSTLCS